MERRYPDYIPHLFSSLLGSSGLRQVFFPERAGACILGLYWLPLQPLSEKMQRTPPIGGCVCRGRWSWVWHPTSSGFAFPYGTLRKLGNRLGQPRGRS